MANQDRTAPSVEPTDHVAQNIESIVALEAEDEKQISQHQRVVEKVTAVVVVPGFFYALLIFFATWIALNTLLQHLGQNVWDPPPFYWLQTAVGFAALLLTTVIVIAQQRQAKLAERRAHLDLQVNLLVDQKAAKIIELLEEMRRDSPILRNRKDQEAESLQTAVDPSAVATALTARIEEASTAITEGEVALTREIVQQEFDKRDGTARK